MDVRLAKEPHFLKMGLPHTLAFTPTILFTMKDPFWTMFLMDMGSYTS